MHRLTLQDLLENAIEPLLPNVTDFPDEILRSYLQKPGLKLVYPCAVYQRDRSKVNYADNRKFFRKKRWTVTIIDRNPDSDIPDLIENLRWSELDRFYVVDGLNHWVFTLYH